MKKQTLKRSAEGNRSIALSDGRSLGLIQPLVMGILNVTPDSFSDGGQFNEVEAATARALQMVEDGADIIDIGGESTRPGADPVELLEEMDRVIPVITRLRQRTDIPISIDTYKAAVAEAAINEGADIVNDISSLREDPEMVKLVARTSVPVVLMHMLGRPKDMQVNPSYEDCVAEIKAFFTERIAFAVSHGVDTSQIIIDPGIGFGKRLADNIDILAELDEFQSLSRPILVGASRKSFIGMLSPSTEPPESRLGGSIAAAVMATLHGADIIRVHDVRETVEAMKVMLATRKGT
jgi:dihydropteroate synthase